MPDVLQQTLYPSGAVDTRTFTDFNGTGCGNTRNITAAECYDGLDTTYEETTTTGDGLGTDGVSEVLVQWNSGKWTTAAVSGPISFVRVITRARVQGGTGATGNIYPVVNSTNGTGTALTNSFAVQERDYMTDPINGGSWTNTKINNLAWGFLAWAQFEDAHSPGTATLRVAEFKLEVWGPSGVTLSGVAAASSTATGGVPTLVPGAVTSNGISAGLITASTSAVSVTPLPTTLASVASATISVRVNPTAYSYVNAKTAGGFVPAAAFSNTNNEPLAVIRCGQAGLNDGSDQTKITNTLSPSGVNRTGTFTVNLGGLSAITSLNGVGEIFGVRLYARIRTGADMLTTPFTNFGFSNGNFTATVLNADWPPLHGDQPANEPYTTVSALVSSLGGVPFVWGSGAGSVAAEMSTAWFFADYTLPATKSIRLDVSEIWIEVLGLASPPDEVYLSQRFQPSNLVMRVTT